MQNLLQELKEVLQQDGRLVAEGRLLRNKIIEMGLRLDPALLKLLLSAPSLKKHFFQEVEGVLVFDKIGFQRFVSQKSFLPDSYTAFKNKIGLSLDGEFLAAGKEVVLAWPYKDCVLAGGQDKEDAKRNETFWSELLASDQIDVLLKPKVLTRWKRYGQEGQQVPEQLRKTDNYIIRGNNLCVLHSLKKPFGSAVKLIYIDPPFNTGSDSFLYNDSFRHATWLTFMKNRLQVARDLLRPDGIICVQIGNEEVAYLRVLMDEIFGRDCYINHVVMTTNDPSGFKATSAGIFSTANHLLFYGKKPGTPLNKLYLQKGYDPAYKYFLLNPQEPFDQWKYCSITEAFCQHKGLSRQELKQRYDKEQLYLLLSQFANEHKEQVFRTAAISGGALNKRRETVLKSKQEREQVMQHPNEDLEGFWILNGEQMVFWANAFKEIDGKLVPARALTDVWTDISFTGIAPEGGVTLKNGKKPEQLLKRVLELCTGEGDLVLDYHLGSGTTCAVAMKLKRRFIGIEQMFYGENDAVVRLENVIGGETSGISKAVGWKGGGSFLYAELFSLGAGLVAQIQEACAAEQLTTLFHKIIDSRYLSYQIDPGQREAIEAEFHQLSLSDRKHFLLEMLDKNVLYLNYSEMEDQDYGVSAAEQDLNQQFYQL